MAKRKSGKKKNWKKLIFRFLLSLSGFLVFLFLVFFFLIYTGFFGPLPDKDALSNIKDERATLVFSADSKLIGKIFAKNRTPIDKEAVPQHLIDALVSTEDSRFYTHNGIDGRSLMRVIVKSIIMGNRSSGGGSTITQQLAKNLYGRKDFGLLTMPVNKIREAILATRLESVYSKDEIILLYLNSVPFGEEVYGIEAAANRYFNKTVSQLEPHEAAMLVGLLKGNTYYHPRLHPDRAYERRNLVLKLMYENRKLSKEDAELYRSRKLSLDYANLKHESPAQYFLHQVRQESEQIIKLIKKEDGGAYDLEKDGLIIETTLDLQLQNYALASIKKQLSAMQTKVNTDIGVQSLKNSKTKEWDNTIKTKREIWTWEGIITKEITQADSAWHYQSMLNASVLVTDPNSGKVKVWIGGNHFRFLPYDLVLSKRMIASAFKPVIYTAALENGIKPCDYFDNEEKAYEEYEDWTPKNYDLTSGGEVALWYALTRSLNIPTVDLYFKIGYEQILDLLKRLNINDLKEDNPSIALGAIDLSLKEAVGIYGIFANEGRRSGLSMIEKIKDSSGKVIYEHRIPALKKVIDSESTLILNQMLEKAINEGTGRRIRSQFGIKSDLAGKTGTSQDFRDAWFMSYTPSMVCGVWVGARDPAIHFSSGSNGSGSALALPIAGELIRNIEKNTDLRKSYLTSFKMKRDSTMFVCEPMRTKGAFNRFLENVFSKDKDTGKDKKEDLDNEKETGDSIEVEGSKVGRFFKKIFKKKK